MTQILASLQFAWGVSLGSKVTLVGLKRWCFATAHAQEVIDGEKIACKYHATV